MKAFNKSLGLAAIAALPLIATSVHAEGSGWDRSQSAYAENYAAGQTKPAEAFGSFDRSQSPYAGNYAAGQTKPAEAFGSFDRSQSPYAGNYAAGQTKPAGVSRGGRGRSRN